jgi:hypothetical protein
MDLFREGKEHRSFLFGIKLTKSEAEWLQAKAMKAGVSKSSFVRKLLASTVDKRDRDGVLQRRRNG